MQYLDAIVVVGGFLAIAACKSGAVRTEVAARIVNPTPQSRTELQHVVSNMLGGRAVTLADDALMNDSMLIIEAKRLTGRDLGRPYHIQLVLNDSECVLVHQESDARVVLMQTDCAAE